MMRVCCQASAWLCRSMWRQRPLEENVISTPLQRCLTLFDLSLLGLGSMCSGGLFNIVSVTMRTLAGPLTFISVFIAGLCAFFNAFCYAELASHLPKSGSAYYFVYLGGGELLAFVVAWTMILEYILSAVMSIVGASLTLDLLLNGALKHFIIQTFGAYPDTKGVLAEYPDIPAFCITLLFIALLSMGTKISVRVIVGSTLFMGGIMLVTAIYMFTFGQGLAWLLVDDSSERQHLVVDSFYTFSSILAGAGVTFNSFNGFDVISISGEEALRPRENIPRAILLAVSSMLVILIFFSIAIGTYIPWFWVEADHGVAGIFLHQGVPSLAYLSGIGTIIAYLSGSMCCLFAVSRIVYSLAGDGLLPAVFGYIHPTRKVPIVAIGAVGLLGALFSLLFDFVSLVKALSMGTLMSYTMVAVMAISMRFNQPQVFIKRRKTKSSLKKHKQTFVTEEANVGHLFAHYDALIARAVGRLKAGQTPNVCVGLFVVFTCFFLLVATHGQSLGALQVPAGLLFLLLLLISASVSLMFKYQNQVQYFHMPGFPFTPFIAILLNLTLIFHLSGLTWLRLIVWSGIGLVVYFAYGIWHSSLRMHFSHQPVNQSEDDERDL